MLLPSIWLSILVGAKLPERQQRLYRHMQMLRRFSEVHGVAIVVTKQVNESPDCYAATEHRKKIKRAFCVPSLNYSNGTKAKVLNMLTIPVNWN